MIVICQRFSSPKQLKCCYHHFLNTITYTLFTCPIFLGFRPRLLVLVSSYNQFFDVTVLKSDYDIKKLIMMQQLEPRAVGLRPTKTARVDRQIMLPALQSVVTLTLHKRMQCHPLPDQPKITSIDVKKT